MLAYENYRDVVLYGVKDNSENAKLMNHLLLLAKFMIYRCKISGGECLFNVFKRDLSLQIKLGNLPSLRIPICT